MDRLEFHDLGPGDAGVIFSLCPGCIYWELPDAFDRRPPADEMRRLKGEWLARHATSRVLGKVALGTGQAVGFVQFGPADLYPQHERYRSGPASDDALLVTCLFVGRRFRRLGVALRLLSLAEETARQQRYAAVEAFARKGSTNNPPGPLELYLRAGYVIFRAQEKFSLVRKEFPIVQPPDDR